VVLLLYVVCSLILLFMTSINIVGVVYYCFVLVSSLNIWGWSGLFIGWVARGF